jgi:hypothetical protein
MVNQHSCEPISLQGNLQNKQDSSAVVQYDIDSDIRPKVMMSQPVRLPG